MSQYKQYTQVEHVLHRPGMYIGSIQNDTISTWIYGNENKMIYTPISMNPGLYKIIDELIVNTMDHSVRLKQENSIYPVKKIMITIENESTIVIYNSGKGIPIYKYENSEIYIPELLFGHLLTSSNYNDSVDRIVGGQNGIGAKACNIFSTKFTIETIDIDKKLSYYQEFSNNMTIISKPIIKKTTVKYPYTKISFTPDYTRFGMEKLSNDMIQCIYKRSLDVCALTSKNISVYWNNDKLNINSFVQYISLYTHHPMVVYTEEDWDVYISKSSNGSFQHVSFVNGIYTWKGGKHVDYICSQCVKQISEFIQKKTKEDIKSSIIKDSLFIGVSVKMKNPSFDSQLKDTFTTPISQWERKPIISSNIIKKLCTQEYIQNLKSYTIKRSEPKHTSCKKKKIYGIPKLEDANWAGTIHSSKCTLILTEGDSAKSMVMGGLSVVGRDRYGVFPLKGKVMNTRECSMKKIRENVELMQLKTILGLEFHKTYTSTNELRYGNIMILTDQDTDGFHIKGLLFNLFHSLWPSLLHIDNFLSCMLTPILKVTKKDQCISFYHLIDFNKWKDLNALTGWKIKYYKGLGTSTANEAKEYFKKFNVVHYFTDEHTDNAFRLSFDKNSSHLRKEWIQQYNPSIYLNYSQDKSISYNTFIQKEFIHYSVYNVERSIPHICDGLKKSQRKILYCCFKRNLTSEIKVSQLSGYISEHGSYHHGENSLQDAIINMAQDFVGSNNIPLLLPNGQFGTRLSSNDNASPRYIYTQLNHLTPFIFMKEDLNLLEYLEEDGQCIEPTFYIPIIPFVLINGIQGIGTGFSTSIPCYHILDVISNIRQRLLNKPTETLVPYYDKFTGTIKCISSNKYISIGKFHYINETEIDIVELPIGTWTDTYKEFLEEYMKSNSSILKSYTSYCTDTLVHFKLYFHPNTLKPMLDNMDKHNISTFEYTFKLTSSKMLSLNNIHLFNHSSVIQSYDNIEDIIQEFFYIRYSFYQKRKQYKLTQLTQELDELESKMTFIESVINGTIVLWDFKKDELNDYLEECLFVKRNNSYGYLTSIPMMNFTSDYRQSLYQDITSKKCILEEIKDKSEKDMWLEDLNILEKEYKHYKGI